MTDEQKKRAMRSVCDQFAYMCSLPKTENTPREQRMKDRMDGILKSRSGRDLGCSKE